MPAGTVPVLQQAAEEPAWRGATPAVAAAFVVYGVAFGAWTLWGGGSPRQRVIISDLAVLPVDLGAAVFAWRAARHAALAARSRQAWRLIGLALLAWAMADCLWAFLEVVLDESPFPSVADAFYLAFYPLLLAGLGLAVPTSLRGTERRRLLIDALTVTVVASSIVWVVAIAPTSGEMHSLLARALNVAYPVGDMIVAFGVAALLLRRPPPAAAAALRLLMLGALSFMAADLTYARLSLSGSYEGGDFPDALWVSAMVLFLVAAAVQTQLATRPRVGPPAPVVHRVNLLPYLAVGASFGLLAARASAGGAELVVYIVAAFLVAVLVSVRQLLALRDNARLNVELQRLTADLERALEETRVALAVATEEQERSRRFLADATHQLRTPVAGLQAAAEALLRGAPPQAAETLLQAIGRETTRAGRIIADLMTLVRIDQNPVLQRKPTDVVALCAEEAARTQARVVGVEVEVGTPATCVGDVAVDPDAVRAIVANLLDNARRHARRSIVLDVAQSGPTVDIRVRDDGPGLDPATAESVFDRFVALDGERGSGLGLAIARGYARAHAGDLVYEEGAFVLTLPMTTGAGPRA